MNVIETIQIDDTNRVLVVSDDDAQCPRGDWSMLTGFVKIEHRGDSRRSDVPAVFDAPIDIVNAYELGRDDETVTRWARIFHGVHVEYDSEHGGYWFVDPAEYEKNWADGEWCHSSERDGLTVEFPTKESWLAEIIKQEQEVYRQWADGEVVGLVHEKLVTWAMLGPDHDLLFEAGDTIRRGEWEQEESIWGLYSLNTMDDYLCQISENFGLAPALAASDGEAS